MMKKILYILVSLTTLASCIPALDKTNDLPVDGMWTSTDNDGFTSQYIEFRNGYYRVFDSSRPSYYAEETIWAANKSDFKKIMQQEYSIINNTLHLDNSTSPISVFENTLSLGNQKYFKLSDFTSKYYSKITCDTPKDLIFQYGSAEACWNYSVDRRPLGDKINVSSNVDWVKSIAVNKDNFSFELEENNSGEGRKAVLTLSYPTASSIEIELEQTYLESKILLNPKSTSSDYTGGSFDFRYEIDHPRDGVSPTISCDTEWITEIADNNGRVTFNILENNSGAERSGEILITYGSISETHTVTQAYSSPKLELTSANLTIDYKGGRYPACQCIVENPRKDWVINAECEAGWISNLNIDKDSDTSYTIELEVQENNSTEPIRTAVIDITYGTISRQFTITQTSDAPKITLSNGSQSCGYEEKKYNFSYSIENPRESLTPKVTCSEEWITEISDENGNVSFKVKENNTGDSRDAEILITYGNVTARYIVQQEYTAPQIFLYTDKDEYDYHAARGSISYHIENHRKELSIKVSCEADWITNLEYSEGNEDGNIFFDIKENNDSEAYRTAYITVSYGSLTERYDITQTSNAPKIVLVNGGQSCSYEGKTYSFTYSIENPRESITPKVTCNSQWITELKDNDGTVSFTVLENNSGASRSDEIHITYGNVSARYFVQQEYTAPQIFLYTDKDEYDYHAARGSISYHIENHRKELSIKVSCEADWITNLEYSEGNKDGNIFFDIKENNDSEAYRTAYITVSYGPTTESYYITQTSNAPKIILVNEGQSCSYEEKSYSFSYSIENPRESFTPKVTCDSQWITGLTDNNGIVSFTVLENNSGGRRSDEILITYGSASARYIVQQEYLEPRLSLFTNKSEYNYQASQGSIYYLIENIRKDLDINISCQAEWLTILERKGDNQQGEVFFSIAENNDSEPSRSAQIVLSYGEFYTTIEISQTNDNPRITFNTEGQACSYEAKSYGFTYSIENPRESLTPKVTCNAGWITGLTDNKGNITFNVTENNSGYDREAEIWVHYGNVSAKYFVHQEYTAPDIRLYAETNEYGYQAGSGKVYYKIENSRKELSVHVSCNVEWITNLRVQGNNETGEILFDLKENNEPLRTTEIIVTYGPSTNRFNITQTGDEPKITLSNGGQSCGYEEKKYSFSYSIENPRESLTPKVTCSAEWITEISDENGNVSFKVKENNTGDSRDTEILITYGNVTARYIVQQEYTAPQIFLYTDKDEYDYHAARGSISYHIENHRKELSIKVSCEADWITNLEYSEGNKDGNIFFDIKENNDSEAYRTAYITVSYGPTTESYYITQTSNAPKIVLVNGGQSCSYEEKSYSFSYSIENPRESLTPKVTCSAEWITEISDENGNVSFKVKENNTGDSRDTEILITYGNVTARYIVQQEYTAPQIFLYTDKDEYDYHAARGSISYHIENHRKELSIKVSCEADWITDLEYSEGNKDGNIFFDIKENNDSEAYRTAYITVSYGPTTESYYITQTSNAPKIILVNGGQSSSYEEKTYSFTYSIENPRESITPMVTCNSQWITGLKDNGGTVSFTVLENNSGASRSDEIHITYGNVSARYFVQQEYTAPNIFLQADKEIFDYRTAESSILYHIENSRKNLMPQVSCNAEWVTILSCEGNNTEGRIFFRIDENNDSGAERSAQIVVSYGDVVTTQNITQTSDAPKIVMVNGGQSSSFEEKTYSFTYSIENPRESITPRVTCNSQWITGLKDNDGTVSFTVLENNSGATRSDEIHITYGEVSATYFVQQEYVAPIILLQADKEIFDYHTAESSMFYHIENSRKNLKLNVSCNAEWVTILSCEGDNTEGRIFFRVDENNDSGSERSAQIVVSYGDVMTTQNITQTSDAPKIVMVNGGQSSSYEEKTYSFTYSIENPRESITPRVTCNSQWITGLKDNDGTVSFTVLENNSGASRSDEIHITYGNVSARYFVQQEYIAPDIFLQADKEIFDYHTAESSMFYHIENSRKNLKLNVSCNAEWVTILSCEGDNKDGRIFFRVDENNDSESERSTQIVISYGDVMTTQNITQTSDAPKIVMANEGQSSSYEEKSYSFTFSIENPRESLSPEVVCRSEWITDVKNNNGTVSFTLLENNSGASRSDEIHITYGNVSAKYFIYQEYIAPDIYLQADKEIFDYRTAESSILYHIENSRKNLMPQVSCNAEWVTILSCEGNNKDGRIFFRIDENNDSGVERSAQIVVSYGDVMTTQNITQTRDASKINLVYGGQTCSYEEKTYSFTYSIENPRESITPKVTCNSQWITGLKDNDGTVSFTVLENNSGASRSDEIHITYGNVSARYFVQQEYIAPDIFLQADKEIFDYRTAESSILYHIENSRKNLKLNVSCNAEWVTILSCEGNNKDGRIFFRIDENNDSGVERSAQIVVSYGDVMTTQNITQTRDVSKINLVYGGQTCSYEEKTYSFTYSIENPRESITPRITCNSQWITGLKDNDGTVSFTVLENNSGASRSDEIHITYGNVSARYFVQQEYTAPDIFLQADKENFDYRTAESSILYHIENSRKNLKLNVSCNAEWVTILSCEGNNKDGRIFFRVDENNDSRAERSAQIVVSYGDVTTTQYITQTNDVPKITLVNGGQNCNYEEKTYSFTYNIENPRETITPRVSTYASWIKGLTINNGIVTFTVEENNSGASRSDEIKITYGNCSAIYFIEQTYTAPTVFFNMNSSDFDYKGGIGRIEYYIANSRKNIKLKLSCEASWVTDLRYNGDQTSGEILFNVSENQTSQDRSTYIDANYVVTSETHHIYQTGK